LFRMKIDSFYCSFVLVYLKKTRNMKKFCLAFFPDFSGNDFCCHFFHPFFSVYSFFDSSSICSLCMSRCRLSSTSRACSPLVSCSKFHQHFIIYAFYSQLFTRTDPKSVKNTVKSFYRFWELCALKICLKCWWNPPLFFCQYYAAKITKPNCNLKKVTKHLCTKNLLIKCLWKTSLRDLYERVI